MRSGGYGNRMKLYKGIIFLASALLLESCAKDGVQVPTPLSTYNLSAYANNEFTTFNATATNHGDTVLDIYSSWTTNIGQTYNLNLLNLQFKSNPVGTYTLNEISEGDYYSVQSGSSPPVTVFYYQTAHDYQGTVKITSYDNINNTITGTFSFTGINSGQNTININNGVFNRIPIH